MAGGYGLSDSDFDEFLESESSQEAPAPSLLAPATPQLHKVVTASTWRGPAQGVSGDGCRTVPANRCAPSLPSSLTRFRIVLPASLWNLLRIVEGCLGRKLYMHLWCLTWSGTGGWTIGAEPCLPEHMA